MEMERTPIPIQSQIWSYVDHKDICRARRVCKTWKKRIDADEESFRELCCAFSDTNYEKNEMWRANTILCENARTLFSVLRCPPFLQNLKVLRVGDAFYQDPCVRVRFPECVKEIYLMFPIDMGTRWIEEAGARLRYAGFHIPIHNLELLSDSLREDKAPEDVKLKLYLYVQEIDIFMEDEEDRASYRLTHGRVHDVSIPRISYVHNLGPLDGLKYLQVRSVTEPEEDAKDKLSNVESLDLSTVLHDFNQCRTVNTILDMCSRLKRLRFQIDADRPKMVLFVGELANVCTSLTEVELLLKDSKEYYRSVTAVLHDSEVFEHVKDLTIVNMSSDHTISTMKNIRCSFSSRSLETITYKCPYDMYESERIFSVVAQERRGVRVHLRPLENRPIDHLLPDCLAGRVYVRSGQDWTLFGGVSHSKRRKT